MNVYNAGEVIVCTFIVKDPDNNNAPVDPTTLTFTYRVDSEDGHQGSSQSVLAANPPSSAPSNPGVGVIARLGTGSYVTWVDSTNQVGYFKYRWESTGTGQTTATGAGRILDTSI